MRIIHSIVKNIKRKYFTFIPRPCFNLDAWVASTKVTIIKFKYFTFIPRSCCNLDAWAASTTKLQ